MSDAANLLNSLSAGMGDAESHIIINNDRSVFVPEELRKIAVQYDHNIETVTFDCPRYWDDRDLSQMVIYINYVNAGGKIGSYKVADVNIDRYEPNTMHFTWTLSRNVTEYKGSIKFLVCAKDVDKDGNETQHWNSELNTQMYVTEGLECGETITEQYPDVITKILKDLDTIEAGGVTDETILHSYVFDDMGKMHTWLAVPTNERKLRVGDMFYIKTTSTGTPNYQWNGTEVVIFKARSADNGGTGGEVDLSDYYTKTETDAQILRSRYEVCVTFDYESGIYVLTKGLLDELRLAHNNNKSIRMVIDDGYSNESRIAVLSNVSKSSARFVYVDDCSTMEFTLRSDNTVTCEIHDWYSSSEVDERIYAAIGEALEGDY